MTGAELLWGRALVRRVSPHANFRIIRKMLYGVMYELLIHAL